MAKRVGNREIVQLEVRLYGAFAAALVVACVEVCMNRTIVVAIDL